MPGFKYLKDHQNQAPREKLLEEDISFPGITPVPWCSEALRPQVG